nr:hypothetical protein [Tanacetum cinerariifolium]
METKDTLSSCSNSKAQQMQQIQGKAKKSFMVTFRQLHSHLERLSQNDLNGTRIESGFKRAFATLFGQDVETFIGTMFLNVEQLEKQLEKEDSKEIGSMAAFNVLETQFQMFIASRIYLDDEYKSIDKRGRHKREYDSWVNKRQMQTTKEKVDTSKALDASLVDTKRSGTESKEQDTSSRSGNDAYADDADIIPIYDEEPMAKVQTIAEINVFATGQKHTEQPKFNNKGEVDQNADECHDTCPLPAILIDNQIPKHSYQSLKSENQVLKEGQQNQFSKEKSNEAKVKHDIDECVFSANHDSGLTKLHNEVNSRAKVPSNKTTNKNKPIEQISILNKQERQIPTGHRFSIKKTFVVQKKTMTPRSCLRWKPTGRISMTVGLRWVPTGKILTTSTTKVDSEPPNGSNEDITNHNECEQNLNVSACTLNLSAELEIHDYINEQSSSKLVPKVVPPIDKTATSRQKLKLLFHHHITMLRLVPLCFAIFDLEPSSLSFDFVISSEIFKSLDFNLDRLFHLVILCLNQHAHTLHHLESLLTISLDRLDILKDDLVYQSLRKSLSLCLSFLDS